MPEFWNCSVAKLHLIAPGHFVHTVLSQLEPTILTLLGSFRSHKVSFIVQQGARLVGGAKFKCKFWFSVYALYSFL